MKTPDDTKKRLDNPIQVHFHVGDIEPRLTPLVLHDLESLHADALAYIQQLEAANAELLTRCERLERERDAAVKVVKATPYSCEYCKHHESGGCDSTPLPYAECFEWRGVKEE